MSDLDRIDQHISAIRQKLNSMPTTRECWAFVLGFAMCGAFIVGLVALS
jgi:hypothetical protein